MRPAAGVFFGLAGVFFGLAGVGVFFGVFFGVFVGVFVGVFLRRFCFGLAVSGLTGADVTCLRLAVVVELARLRVLVRRAVRLSASP